MGVGILPVHIVRIIGGDDRYVELPGKLHQHLIHPDLFGYLVALKFYIVILPEQVQPPFEFSLARFLTLFQNGSRYRSAQATGGGDQPLMILQEQLFINAWIFAVKPLYKSQGA